MYCRNSDKFSIFSFLPYVLFCFHDITIGTYSFNVRKGQKAAVLEAGDFPGLRDSFNACDPVTLELSHLHPSPQLEQEQSEHTLCQ